VGVSVGVSVGIGVEVRVSVAVSVGVDVEVGVAVGKLVGACGWITTPRAVGVVSPLCGLRGAMIVTYDPTPRLAARLFGRYFVEAVRRKVN
jgi:hypothetical protein